MSVWTPTTQMPPKDTPVLVYDPEMRHLIGTPVFVAYWHPHPLMDSEVEWVPLIGKDNLVAQPTHWMPLPQEP